LRKFKSSCFSSSGSSSSSIIIIISSSSSSDYDFGGSGGGCYCSIWLRCDCSNHKAAVKYKNLDLLNKKLINFCLCKFSYKQNNVQAVPNKLHNAVGLSYQEIQIRLKTSSSHALQINVCLFRVYFLPSIYTVRFFCQLINPWLYGM
jgi:hypothetical protein